MLGKIKWFNQKLGYGFIKCNNYEDIFFHYSQLNQDGYKTINEGEYVTFVLLKTNKGYQAINLKKTIIIN